MEAAPESRIRRVRRNLSRRLGRWGAVALFLGALAVTLVLLDGRWSPGPDRGPSALAEAQTAALAEYQRDLAAHRPITLLGEDRLPRYYRWRTERQRPPLAPQGPGPLMLQTWSTCLLELLPDPQVEAYRLSAEVNINPLNPCLAGVYCLAEERVRPSGRDHSFLALTFREEGVGKGRARLEAFCYREASESRVATGIPYTLAAVPLGPGPWHTLTVEVVGTRVCASCDQRPLPPVELKDHGWQIRTWWEGQGLGKDTPPTFPAQGPLGLFARGGAASFKNVTLTPVAPAQPQ